MFAKQLLPSSLQTSTTLSFLRNLIIIYAKILSKAYSAILLSKLIALTISK